MVKTNGVKRIILFFSLIATGLIIILATRNLGDNNKIAGRISKIELSNDNYELAIQHGNLLRSIEDNIENNALSSDTYKYESPDNLLNSNDFNDINISIEKKDNIYILTSLVEPYYFNEDTFSIKNTFIIPTMSKNEYFYSFRGDSNVNLKGQFKYFLYDLLTNNLSDKVLELPPDKISEHFLSPVFSITNLVCYSEIKHYEESSEQYRHVLTSNSLSINYHFNEHGIDDNNEFVESLVVFKNIFSKSDFFGDLDAIAYLYTSSSKQQISLIDKVVLFDSNDDSIEMNIFTPSFDEIYTDN